MNLKNVKNLGCLLIAAFVISTTVAAKDKLPTRTSFEIEQTDTGAINSALIASIETSTSAEEIALKAAAAAEAKNSLAKAATISSKEMLFKQLHPLSIIYVQSYQKKNEGKLLKIETKFTRQFAAIDNILTKYNLPTELKYLAIIESELNNTAISNKGAVGPWQFMAPTGRLMGLTINKHRDERRDFTKSTHAAAKYLKVLYSQFNDWLLVIAAYNGGASRVEYAIKKANSRDFWRLQHYLPAESRMHVKKYVATKYVFESKAAETTDPLLNVAKLTELELSNSAVTRLSGKYKAFVITTMLEMDAADFDHYNPGFDNEVIVNGYDLRLPKEKMELFNTRRSDILGASIQNMLSETGSIISSGSREQFPEAIQIISKPKAIKPGEQKKKSTPAPSTL